MEEDKNILRQYVESGHSINADLFANNLRKCEVLFSLPSKSVLNMLQRFGITFDMAVFDDAGGMNEFETWWTTLPLV